MLEIIRALAHFQSNQLTQVMTALVALTEVAASFGWITPESRQALMGLFGAGVALGIARKPVRAVLP